MAEAGAAVGVEDIFAGGSKMGALMRSFDWSTTKPDVLLSDIGMPEADGYMLIRQIRTLSPEKGGQIPAIALTAYAGELDQQQALAVGFQKHMAKPVEPAELIAAIVNLVRHSEL